jgi:hypothetical protein|tara:strand:- start:2800 stop:3027 length:228 start_codon:yes stop_codon:yes gene_type:complete
MSKETNEMNQGQAVNVLIQAARIAQGKGAFTLEDAEMVAKAIKVFVPPTTEAEGEDANAVVNEEGPTEPVIEKVK